MAESTTSAQCATDRFSPRMKVQRECMERRADEKGRKHLKLQSASTRLTEIVGRRRSNGNLRLLRVKLLC